MGEGQQSQPSVSPVPAETHASLRAIARAFVELERKLVDLQNEMQQDIDRVAADWRESATNLVHYVALRQQDLRDLQAELSKRGLSSLGRSESCVMGSLLEASERAHEALALRGDEAAGQELARMITRRRAAISWETATDSMHAHTRDVLGPCPSDRHIYIMVTAPSAKEADRAWMVKMLSAGMNVLRINCAHEGERSWERMIAALHDAQQETGKECRVLMDLAGPKIRTGSIAGGRPVATWKPAKDYLGRMEAPARVVIRRASAPCDEDARAFLTMDDGAFANVRKGDELSFTDARGKQRIVSVNEVGSDELVTMSSARTYVLGEARAGLHRGGELVAHVTIAVASAEAAAINVMTGETLVLTGRATEGKPPRRDAEGRVEKPGVIACTLPAALEHLEVGHRILFDDGRIHAVVTSVDKESGDFLLRVVRTHKLITKLRAEKGINLPDTLMTPPSLTEDDLVALAFVAAHADAVSLSFVRRPDDVRRLHDELDRLGRRGIGVVLKIETRAGFESLPRLLLEGMRRPPLAVMIARGDLAVEVGYERLAELQEEILWICEAGHVPAIWATQVLDMLARTGVPSRAEITDAATSVAAECVMLNKGPFIGETVSVLSDILRRMEKHRYKKRSLFRKLQVSMIGPPKGNRAHR